MKEYKMGAWPLTLADWVRPLGDYLQVGEAQKNDYHTQPPNSEFFPTSSVHKRSFLVGCKTKNGTISTKDHHRFVKICRQKIITEFGYRIGRENSEEKSEEKSEENSEKKSEENSEKKSEAADGAGRPEFLPIYLI